MAYRPEVGDRVKLKKDIISGIFVAAEKGTIGTVTEIKPPGRYRVRLPGGTLIDLLASDLKKVK